MMNLLLIVDEKRETYVIFIIYFLLSIFTRLNILLYTIKYIINGNDENHEKNIQPKNANAF